MLTTSIVDRLKEKTLTETLTHTHARTHARKYSTVQFPHDVIWIMVMLTVISSFITRDVLIEKFFIIVLKNCWNKLQEFAIKIRGSSILKNPTWSSHDFANSTSQTVIIIRYIFFNLITLLLYIFYYSWSFLRYFRFFRGFCICMYVCMYI